LLICSSDNENLDWFFFLAITNNTEMNICVQGFMKVFLFFFQTETITYLCFVCLIFVVAENQAFKII
jgi:hypothetical protein